MITQEFNAKGHTNVLATHTKTLEITTEDFLTPKGDCIIAVESELSLNGLRQEIKDAIRAGGLVIVKISCNGISETITGQGHPKLSLESDVSMVLRRSNFICPRTLCIRCDKTAADMDRCLIEELKRGDEVRIDISVGLKSKDGVIPFL
jgi:uncharacterized protein